VTTPIDPSQWDAETRAEVEALLAKRKPAAPSKAVARALKEPPRYALDWESPQPPRIEPGATVHVRNCFGQRKSGTVKACPEEWKFVVEVNGRELVVWHYEDCWQ
jgi:hypothetical protein